MKTALFRVDSSTQLYVLSFTTEIIQNLQIPEQVSTKMQNTQTSLDLLIKQNKTPKPPQFSLFPSLLLRVILSKQLLDCTFVCPHLLYPFSNQTAPRYCREAKAPWKRLNINLNYNLSKKTTKKPNQDDTNM